MSSKITAQPPKSGSAWLRNYYFTRVAVAAVWVALAFTLGRSAPLVTAILVVVYPAWDALANAIDANRNGGLARNKSQAVNLAVSLVAAVAVAVALGSGMRAVLDVFGVWAILAGLLQLATGLRRWKSEGGQWAMILSGGQSALVGAFFFKQAEGAKIPDITAIAPYAAFGAFYFLISATWLTIAGYRNARAMQAVGST